MLQKIVFVLFIMDFSIISQAVKRPFYIEFHNMICNFPPPLVKHFGCEVYKVTPTTTGMNVMFELTRRMPMATDVEVLLHYKLARGNIVVKFLDVTLKVCDVLTHVHTLPIVKKFMIVLRRSSNLPLMCPLDGDVMFNVTNFIFSDDMLPPFTPISQFNVTMNYYEKKKLLAHFKLEGSTIARSKKK